MPSSTTSDLRQDSPRMKQYGKFYSGLLCKETSIANHSFRIYYGGAAGAVPFLWESQPGTPKNTIPTTTLPPLTPPPSYQSNKMKNCTNKSPKATLMRTIFPRLTLTRTHPKSPPSLFSLPSPSVSSSSSSSSYLTTNSSGSRRRSRFSSTRSSFSSQGDEEDDGSPRSTLCFGLPMSVIMKNALLSIVRHGSNQGTMA